MKELFETLFYYTKNSSLIRTIVFYLLGIVIIISIYYIFLKFYPEMLDKYRDILRISVLIISGLALTSLFFSYLNINNDYKSSLEYEVYNLNIKLNNLIEDQNKTNEKFINSLITSNEKETLLNKIQSNIENGFTNEYFEKLHADFKNNDLDNYIQLNIRKSINRLTLESDSLNKRGNVNLFIGLILSIIGLGILGATLRNFPDANNFTELFINITPRTIFVILVEVFSYFFLNLYRKSLDEIKYYQNEITNLEAKYLSLKVAISLNNHKIIANTLENLIKTERNFILEKDQTTIDLEKERINSNNTNNTLQTIKDIFKSKE